MAGEAKPKKDLPPKGQIGYGVLTLASAVAAWVYFTHVEHTGGVSAMPGLVALIYKVVGKVAIVTALGLVGVAGLAMGIVRVKSGRSQRS